MVVMVMMFAARNSIGWKWKVPKRSSRAFHVWPKRVISGPRGQKKDV